MKSSAPAIGLICYGKAKDPKWYSLPIPYVEAIRRSGGHSVIIPPGERDVGAYLDLIHGFVLAGGGDIEPHHFGQEHHPKNSDIDPDRDVTELEMTRALIDKRVPTLAICRGIQILNVALGGDLMQHLEDVVGTDVKHQEDGGEAVLHSVRLEPGSQVAKVCGDTSFEVSSKHHQAAGRIAEDLKATSWTSDGIVEAIEMEGHPEIIGVQWHPETTAAGDPGQQALFDWLIDLSRK